MLTIAKGMLNSVADTLSTQLTDMIMGTSPLQVAAAQGKIIATSFLAAGSQVAAQLHAAIFGKTVPFSTSVTSPTSVLGSGSGAGTAGGILNFLKGAAGGALGFARGLLPFASGGVVNRPTAALIGEGKYNEAVVPLPNGKAIPVQMNGAGQNNNVTVNVAIDGNGNASTNTQQDSQQAGNLGTLIARAVQQELQNQKRSGGILNPYGVA
jgi:phage-related minor tail protein